MSKKVAKRKFAEVGDVLTITEVSNLLQLTPVTLKRWGKQGRLPFIRINKRGDRRYYKKDIINFLNNNHE